MVVRIGLPSGETTTPGRTRAGLGLGLGLVALLALVACGSGNSNASSGTADNGANAEVVAAAKEALKPYTTNEPKISLTPLSARPEAGKTVAFVGCPAAVCRDIEVAANAAADELGWEFKAVNGGLTPETFTSAMNSVAQNPPDGVLAIGISPNSTIKAQLESLKSAGVPFVGNTSSSEPDELMIANFSAAPEVAASGKVMANWIVADSGAAAKTAYFWDPSFTQHKPAMDSFVAETKSMCPSCEADVQTMNFSTGIGTTAPKQVVSYLQRNPDTNYVVIGLGDATAGIPEAIAAAGLKDKVKIVTRSTGPLNFANISKGTEAMGVTSELSEAGWRMTDILARVFAGEEIKDSTPVGTLHVVTKDSLPSDLTKPYTVPNYESFFRTAWNLEK